MAHNKATSHVRISGLSTSILVMVHGKQNLSSLIVYLGQSSKMSDTELHITGSKHEGWVGGQKMAVSEMGVVHLQASHH
jgi:hypothetical protein